MDFLLFVCICLLGWTFFGMLTAHVAKNRGSDGCVWFASGVIFGPFALLAAFLFIDDRHCPYCQKSVAAQAVKCPYCQSDIARPAVPEQRWLPCSKCNQNVPQGAIYCGYCGAKL